ncbi:MAG: DUF4332 domain-containing protein [Anaerolineales bacterium]|nr:MAG: DUF4332 domain-containing protein [Anaerolineales bacterium]
MDVQAFAQHLRKSGKKAHVVAGLVGQVRQFEQYLGQERHKSLGEALPQDLQDYLAASEANKPGKGKTMVRGLALYYHFAGLPDLASTASELRERQIAKTRKIFELKDFRSVDPAHISRLEALGIVNVQHMREAGKTPQDREALAIKSGVPSEAILELVKLADLARIQGLKSIRARLYHDAGADTLEKIAQWEPEELRKMLAEFVNKTKFEGIAPLPKEVNSCVKTARRLPKIIQY